MTNFRARVDRYLKNPHTIRKGSTAPPEEDDMPTADEIADAVWEKRLRKVNARDKDGNYETWQARTLQEWSYGHSAKGRTEVREAIAAVAANKAAIDALAKALAEHGGQSDPEKFAADIQAAAEAGAKAALEALPIAAVLTREEEEQA